MTRVLRALCVATVLHCWLRTDRFTAKWNFVPCVHLGLHRRCVMNVDDSSVCVLGAILQFSTIWWKSYWICVMNVVSSSSCVLTHRAHRAISYIWTLGGASGRTFLFADVGFEFKNYVWNPAAWDSGWRFEVQGSRFKVRGSRFKVQGSENLRFITVPKKDTNQQLEQNPSLM